MKKGEQSEVDDVQKNPMKEGEQKTCDGDL